jgi:hypothetical protein
MTSFTKDELRELFKEFLYIIGSDVPDGQIKSAWERFCQVKQNERLKAELEELVHEGFLEAVYDETLGEWRYTPTEKGLASPKAAKLERMA